MAKKNKLTFSKLVKKADKICSEYIRRRDEGICCTCANKFNWKYGGDCGHWIPKTNSNWGTRYDERNMHFQCQPCNRFACPVDDYAAFMEKKYGKDIMDELRVQKVWTLEKFSNVILGNDIRGEKEALLCIIAYYNAKLKELDKKKISPMRRRCDFAKAYKILKGCQKDFDDDNMTDQEAENCRDLMKLCNEISDMKTL
jgi:hypothetical protein